MTRRIRCDPSLLVRCVPALSKHRCLPEQSALHNYGALAFCLHCTEDNTTVCVAVPFSPASTFMSEDVLREQEKLRSAQ